MALTYDGTNGITFNDGSQMGTASALGMRNRLINGCMRYDQRNNGVATTNTINGYATDRWQVLQGTTGKLTAQQMQTANTSAANYESNSVPAGHFNSLKITSQSAYSVGSNELYRVVQIVEGINWADMSWGTSAAATVTLSFLVKSSLTGTFGGVIGRTDGARTYPFTYTINSANTWQQVTIVIPGDTVGTYLADNSGVLYLQFSLGLGSSVAGGTAFTWGTSAVGAPSGVTSLVGTNAATWYITGVQLERGSVATPFEYRQYGQELALCQRYYQLSNALAGVADATTTRMGVNVTWGTAMRATPTFGLTGVYSVSDVYSTDITQTTATWGTIYGAQNGGSFGFLTGFTGLISSRTYITRFGNTNAVTLSAEL
jgi:hypothetical protein